MRTSPPSSRRPDVCSTAFAVRRVFNAVLGGLLGTIILMAGVLTCMPEQHARLHGQSHDQGHQCLLCHFTKQLVLLDCPGFTQTAHLPLPAIIEARCSFRVFAKGCHEVFVPRGPPVLHCSPS